MVVVDRAIYSLTKSQKLGNDSAECIKMQQFTKTISNHDKIIYKNACAPLDVEIIYCSVFTHRNIEQIVCSKLEIFA